MKPEALARMDAAARAGLARWGAGGEPALLQYRENAVYRVVGPDGAPAVLRVHRRGYHGDLALKSELAWMARLRAGGLAVPAPVAMPDGAPFAVVDGFQVDMLGWLDGPPLGAIGTPLDLAPARRTAVFEALGAAAADLHTLSLAWHRPAWFTRHAWDLDGLTGARPLWGHPWALATLAPDQAGLLRRAEAAARDDLRAHGRSSDSYGLIHADLLPENLLLAGDAVQLIDFDDSGFGWHMFELATALFWHRAEPNYRALEAALRRGYQRHRRLSDTAWEALPLFTLLRGLSYVGWTHTRGRELTATLVFDVCALADDYLARR